MPHTQTSTGAQLAGVRCLTKTRQLISYGFYNHFIIIAIILSIQYDSDGK